MDKITTPINMQALKIYRATIVDTDLVVMLVYRLLREIHPDAPINENRLVKTCQDILEEDNNFFALLAVDQESHRPLSVVTLAEAMALHAYGRIGIIMEHYVVPEARNLRIGEMLLHKANEMGRERDWMLMQVAAPGAEMQARTQSFYERNGFAQVGPYMQRKIIAEDEEI